MGEPKKFTSADIHPVPVAEIQKVFTEADTALDDKFKERYPVRRYAEIARQNRDGFAGILPVRLGKYAGIVTARLVVHAADITEFNRKAEGFEEANPEILLTRRSFGNPRTPSNLGKH